MQRGVWLAEDLIRNCILLELFLSISLFFPPFAIAEKRLVPFLIAISTEGTYVSPFSRHGIL